MMKFILRLLALAIVLPATYMFTYWVPLSFMPFIGSEWIRGGISLFAAGLAGWYVWNSLGSAQPNRTQSTLSSAIVVGSAGFCAGFYGPVIFNPSANLGPMLGLLLTGPASAVAGAVLGLVLAAPSVSNRVRASSLIVASILVAGIGLHLSMPEPRYHGVVIDAEVRGCKAPATVADAAIQRWEISNGETKWRDPRKGWKEDVARMLREDQGVVLELHVFREREIVENRKPWNKGIVEARAWKTEGKSKDYYTRQAGGSCDKYATGVRSLYAPEWETSDVSPPNKLPSFLGLLIIRPVPDEFKTLIEN